MDLGEESGTTRMRVPYDLAIPADNAVTRPVERFRSYRNDEVAVNATAAPRTVLLASGTTQIEQVIADAYSQSGVNAITVGLADATKHLNGVLNGTVSITTPGAMRGFKRSTGAAGDWIGGV